MEEIKEKTRQVYWLMVIAAVSMSIMYMFLFAEMKECNAEEVLNNTIQNKYEFQPEPINLTNTYIPTKAEEINFESTSFTIEKPHEEKIHIELEIPNIDSNMKTYMSYKAITNKGSKQYMLQQDAYTDENGFRKYNDLYMIALGTTYSPQAGMAFEIEFSSGHIINCITGDVKADIHTDSTNRYVPSNGNIVEFIVDTNLIDELSKKMGDMSYSNMEGTVVRITRIENKQ